MPLPILRVGDFVRVTVDATHGTMAIAINGGQSAMIASDVNTNGRPLHPCVLLRPGAAVTFVPEPSASRDARGRSVV